MLDLLASYRRTSRPALVICSRRCASPAAARLFCCRAHCCWRIRCPWTDRRTDRRTRYRFSTLTNCPINLPRNPVLGCQRSVNLCDSRNKSQVWDFCSWKGLAGFGTSEYNNYVDALFRLTLEWRITAWRIYTVSQKNKTPNSCR